MPDHTQLIARINELSKFARERELTAEETEERQRLRDQYLLNFRQSFRQQLDNTYVQKDDGEKVPIKDWHQTVERDAESAFSGDDLPDA